MSQSFDLYLATETLADDAQQLGVTPEALQQISVQVSATLVAQPEAYLQLEYRVTLPTESLAALLTWPKWQADKIGFKDYLWEQTCLECFLAGSLISSSSSKDNDKSPKTNMTMSYIEINASPEGQYALYEFDSYRSPTTLPPRPLMYADGQTRAAIDWIDGNNPKLLIDYPISTHERYHYQRSFRMPLDSLTSFNRKSDYSNDALIKYIHPCVILSFGATILYFAPKHASPPDFHNSQYWTPFDRLSALAK